MAKAQPKPDSTDSDGDLETETRPKRPNAATRALANTESDCCGAPTKLKKLGRAKQQFDIALRLQVDQLDHTGDEVVACCTECKNAVGLICE